MRGAREWQNAVAPSLADFEVLAADAWERLPGEFRQLCRDVVFRVEDFATDEVLDELGIEDPFELMGLYKGVSLDRKSVLDQPTEPDMVLLYRRPILDYWSEGEETLGHLVTHVLVHEIGHHFGLSDADMEAIEAEAG
ncbi:MAG: metallopeptidase family protein [Hyphomicrobiaceae bacterium]|nr:metallopeptidase family protein [Hyphomicrobiaceae bacterium]